MWVVLQIFRHIPQNSSPLLDPPHDLPEIKRPLQKERGFTLVEVMVVIVIVGILASIAIGLTVSYREKAYISCMKTDLSNAFKDSVVFFSDFPDDGLTLEILEANGYNVSEDVSIDVVDGKSESLRITATHPKIIGTYEVDKTGIIFRQ
jgi:prepilin-type N-terminal cleavage/methylation domain-containing protein